MLKPNQVKPGKKPDKPEITKNNSPRRIIWILLLKYLIQQ